jgi:hypothetical protein
MGASFYMSGLFVVDSGGNIEYVEPYYKHRPELILLLSLIS